MARIFPQVQAQALLPSTSSSSSSSPEHMTSREEIFTVWMKSLVFNCNGCTVFNSSGGIVYRIDNYDCKCSNEVYLMDLRGKVMFTILKKKLRLFGRWEGYKCNSSSKVEREKPWFIVRKPVRILKKGNYSCEVKVGGCDEDVPICYTIQGLIGKATCNIADKAGRVVAEVKQKQSSSGVTLGDDVLTLVVGPGADQLLVMGLVIVYNLINHNL